MPKLPITYREVFYSPIRGSFNSVTSAADLRRLEWSRVETELGTMVEPTISVGGINATGPITQIDMTDASVSKISIMDDGTFQQQFGTGGPQQLIDFNA